MNRQTLDLDWYFLRRYDLTPEKIIKKIGYFCKDYIYCFECYQSFSLNGFHVVIWCGKEGCDACRLLFDDQRRFQNDLSLRFPFERNVLFFEKSKIRLNNRPNDKTYK
jgi:hypothetical protein